MRRRYVGFALAFVIAIVVALIWYSLEPPAPIVPEFEPAIPQAAVPPESPTVEPPRKVAEPEETEIDATTIDYTTGGTIQGSVSDALTNEPIQDFFLLLKRGQFLKVNPHKHRGYRAYHDPHGLFFLNDLPAEGLTVFVSAEGYEPTLRFLPGIRHDIAVADVDFKLSPVASLTVAVVDPIGQPLQDADVVLAEWEDAQWSGMHPEARTDHEGIARFLQVRAGATPITVFNGKPFVESRANILANTENFARIAFQADQPFDGQVFYDGQPWPGIILSLPAGTAPPTVSDSEGYFTFGHVPKFSGQVSLTIPDYEYLRFSKSVDTRRKKEPLLIDIPRFEAGFRLRCNIDLRANETALLQITTFLPDGVILFLSSGEIRHETMLEFTQIPMADYAFSLVIMNSVTQESVTSGRFSLSQLLVRDSVLEGTLQADRPHERILNLSVTGDYVPL